MTQKTIQTDLTSESFSILLFLSIFTLPISIFVVILGDIGIKLFFMCFIPMLFISSIIFCINSYADYKVNGMKYAISR